MEWMADGREVPIDYPFQSEREKGLVKDLRRQKITNELFKEYARRDGITASK